MGAEQSTSADAPRWLPIPLPEHYDQVKARLLAFMRVKNMRAIPIPIGMNAEFTATAQKKIRETTDVAEFNTKGLTIAANLFLNLSIMRSNNSEAAEKNLTQVCAHLLALVCQMLDRNDLGAA